MTTVRDWVNNQHFGVVLQLLYNQGSKQTTKKEFYFFGEDFTLADCKGEDVNKQTNKKN